MFVLEIHNTIDNSHELLQFSTLAEACYAKDMYPRCEGYHCLVYKDG